MQNSTVPTTTTTTHQVTIPEILTANTYFWSPAGSASCRRANEKRRNSELAEFCEFVNENLPDFAIEASYEESCKHVYLYKSVKRLVKGSEWKKTTLLALKNALKKRGFLADQPKNT